MMSLLARHRKELEDGLIQLLVFGESYYQVTPENEVHTIGKKQFEEAISGGEQFLMVFDKPFSWYAEEFENIYGNYKPQLGEPV